MSSVQTGVEQYTDLVTEQIDYFKNSPLFSRMQAYELLASAVNVIPIEDPAKYRYYSADFEDNPKTDTLTTTIEVATVNDMATEFAKSEGLNEYDIKRLYIATGLANLLILNSFAGPARSKRMERFFDTMSEPCNLYAQAMESPVFDDIQADETASRIATEGHKQTVNVNFTRLSTGMFIEAQPDGIELRSRVEEAFQDELRQLFDGKRKFVDIVIGIFKKQEDVAKDLYANNVEVLLGLALPMRQAEVKNILALLK